MDAARSTQREEEERLLLSQLEEAARALGLRVRVERGSFRSGRCRSRSDELIILNRRLGTFERAQVLARILAREDLDKAFLLPAVRERILELGGASGDGG
ncbi:MAG: hypothetical protein WC326_07280 [Candidatus Delongbacteria bacterium]